VAREVRNIFGFVFAAWTAIGCSGTSSNPPAGRPPAEADRSGIPDHVFAFYNDDNLLIGDALGDIESLIKKSAANPYTDIYVVSHGWNFTMADALATYESYLRACDRVLREPNPSRRVRPLLVLIGWSSVTRPVSETANSLLPFGLDEAISIPTSYVDSFAFHLPSAWKQSLNAMANALGHGFPDDYLRTPPDETRIISRSVSGSLPGLDVPVSSLLHRLMVWNDQARLGGGDRVRLHCVGHSYGAKLMLLASMESLRRFEHTVREPRSGIDSLTLFSPAFHPSEARYRTGGITQEAYFERSPGDLLERIPRKALIYSSYDSTLGLTYELSQLPLNNFNLQIVQQSTNATVASLRDRGLELFVPPVIVAFGGAQFVLASALGVTSWVTRRVVNLPQDFVYHVGNEEMYPSLHPGLAYPLRFVQYFGCSDQQGILRPSTSALGRCGLARHTAGRTFELGSESFVSYGNALPLSRFAGMGNNVGPDEYVRLAKRVVPATECDYADPKRFYSFDGGKVLKSLRLLVGSHAELRNPKVIELGDEGDRVATPVIDSTVRFVLNFSHGEPSSN
jgi:hypothetical protein